jgi:transposase
MGLPSLRALDGAQAARIWLAVEATDMRCGFDRLAERVQAVIGENPLSGHLFVFRSRRGDRLKILHWDRDGFVLWYKRLEEGVFKLPRAKEGARALAATSSPTVSAPAAIAPDLPPTFSLLASIPIHSRLPRVPSVTLAAIPCAAPAFLMPISAS